MDQSSEAVLIRVERYESHIRMNFSSALHRAICSRLPCRPQIPPAPPPPCNSRQLPTKNACRESSGRANGKSRAAGRHAARQMVGNFQTPPEMSRPRGSSLSTTRTSSNPFENFWKPALSSPRQLELYPLEHVHSFRRSHEFWQP